MLRKEARPVLPMTGELHTPCLLDAADPHGTSRPDQPHGLGDLVDDSRISKILDDAELVDTSRHRRDVSISQIDPEQVRVGFAGQKAVVAQGTVGGGPSTGPGPGPGL